MLIKLTVHQNKQKNIKAKIKKLRNVAMIFEMCLTFESLSQRYLTVLKVFEYDIQVILAFFTVIELKVSNMRSQRCFEIDVMCGLSYTLWRVYAHWSPFCLKLGIVPESYCLVWIYKDLVTPLPCSDWFIIHLDCF